jgi:peptidoglycan/xylan/chitin deacetylase (PgdA/CDA1 family)
VEPEVTKPTSLTRIALLAAMLAATVPSLEAQCPAPGTGAPDPASGGAGAAMLFPGGRSKALVLSYDDGRTSDRRLVRLLNAYGLHGTFHLNSNKLGTTDYLARAEVRRLFAGHEVSAHSANHPGLPGLPRDSVIREVLDDRRELERLTGAPVRGMAYPFGTYDAQLMSTIRGLGIEYARTVSDTRAFGLPDDFLAWHPTIHQFGTAYATPDDPERDRREVDGFFQLVRRFLATDSLALLEVWGHSWENDGAGDRWAETERFFGMVARRPDVWSVTQIGLVDYVEAYRGLRCSVSGGVAVNPSATDVYVRVAGRVVRIPAGSTTTLQP